MNTYDSLHLGLRKPIEKAYFDIYRTRNTHNLLIRLRFVFLCKLDLTTAPYINKENDFPTFYYLAEYYYKYGNKPFEAIDTCLKGIKYKFEDVETLYMQLEYLIAYFRKFPQLQFYFDYEHDYLYDENTGVVIDNVRDYFNQIKKERGNNETR